MLNKALCKKCYDMNRSKPWDEFNRRDKKNGQRYNQKERTWSRGKMACVAILDREHRLQYLKTDGPPPPCCYYYLEQTLTGGQK